MKSRKRLFLMPLIMALIISGCKAPAKLPTPTQIPTEVPTVAPTATRTLPTNTPKPTPTTIDDFAVNNEFIVYQGGYSVSVPMLNYQVEVLGGDTIIASRESQFIILINSLTSDEQLPQVSELLPKQTEDFLGEAGEISLGEITQTEFNGIPAAKASYNQVIDNNSFTGEALLILPDDHNSVLILGLAVVDASTSSWEEFGKPEFEQVLTNLELLPEEMLKDRFECLMSTDSTYGFSKDNPIRVGGQAWLGPSRANAYLNNLIDSQGKHIESVRDGSVQYGDTILDLYTINAGQQQYIIYVDQYSWETPLTPIGLNCLGAYPLSKPTE